MLKFYLKNINKIDYLTNCGFGNYSNSYVPLGLILKFLNIKI